MTTKQRRWTYGLVAGFLGGMWASIDSGLAVMIIAPKEFNLDPDEGLGKTTVTMGVLGVLAGAKVAVAYLKQSPLPPMEGDTEFIKPNDNHTMKILFIITAALAVLFLTRPAHGAQSDCLAQMQKQRESTVKTALADYGRLDGKIDESSPVSKISAAPFVSLRSQNSKEQIGGGLAIGYAFTPRLTLEAEVASEGIDDSNWVEAIGDVGGSLKFSFPLKKYPVSPYVIGGYRRDLLENENQLTAGAGLEYGRGKFYGFGDARIVHGFEQDIDEIGNHVLIRLGAGLRF